MMKYDYVDDETLLVYDCKNRTFLISPQDIDSLKYTWYVANQTQYVERKEWNHGANKTQRLHRYICPDYKLVDHINGDKTDNRRINLRLATKSQNAMNSKKPIDNTSGVKGVERRYDKNTGYDGWRATIVVNGKRIHLGCFKDKEKAIAARKAGEEKYFGQYRRTI